MIETLFTTNPYLFLGMMFFATIGASIFMIQNFLNRNVSSTRTPDKASFTFWLKDNVWRIVMGFLMTYLTLRFLFVILPLVPWIPVSLYSGEGVYAISAGVGYMFDRLGKYIIDKVPALKTKTR